MSRILDSRSVPGRAPRLRRRKESGATLVEMALIIMLLLTVLFGIMAFGHALYAYHFVNHVAKEAARWAATNGHACTFDSTCNGTNNAPVYNNAPATAANVNTYVQNFVPPGIVAANVNANTSWPTTANSPTICTAAVGGQGPFNNYPGCTVQVQVTYAFNFIFPLLPPTTTTTAPCTQPGLCMSSTSEFVIVH